MIRLGNLGHHRKVVNLTLAMHCNSYGRGRGHLVGSSTIISDCVSLAITIPPWLWKSSSTSRSHVMQYKIDECVVKDTSTLQQAIFALMFFFNYFKGQPLTFEIWKEAKENPSENRNVGHASANSQ